VHSKPRRDEQAVSHRNNLHSIQSHSCVLLGTGGFDLREFAKGEMKKEDSNQLVDFPLFLPHCKNCNKYNTCEGDGRSQAPSQVGTSIWTTFITYLSNGNE